MDIREKRLNTIKKSIGFIDEKGNVGNYIFHENRFTADKMYKMDAVKIDEPDAHLNLELNNEMYEIILDKDVYVDIIPDTTKFGDSIVFIIRQDSIGYRQITFSPNFKFSHGALPQFTMAPDSIDMLGCIVDSNGQLLCDATLNFM